ncbi:LPXTG cell wall anchor domain-containing protein [Streptomyces sp. KK5PA1]|uniref:LPXTG cell wall anchor domain-containing protein n=2 Tax=Actinacidiphila acididurans TaxID=2784346 RepID=A0ABS2TRP4_9ACTN|nr:LPXTG cell wall anchor domain-containing protein [Actinacidiphila acididurans]
MTVRPRARTAVRPPAVAAGAALLAAAAGLAGVGAAPASATPAGPAAGGTSTATVLRAGLDVSLLGRTADVPVDVSLDDVRAPADAKETALTVTVGHGVEAGRPVGLLRARVATADATAGHQQAEGFARLADAQVHLPGLPLLALVQVDALTSRATCRVGAHPTASSTLAGVTVLGRRIAAHAIGTTNVVVPGVGTVRLDLTPTTTTSATAAATALRLHVHINPLSLGVADVTGDVVLAEATCHTPQQSGSTSGGTTTGQTGGSTAGSSGGSTGSGGTSSAGANGGQTSGSSAGNSAGNSAGGSTSGATGGSSSSGTSGPAGATASGGTGGRTRTGTDPGGNLAETGSSSAMPYVALGATGLVAAGAVALVLTNRRRRANSGAGGGA